MHRDYAKPLATNRHLLRWVEKMRDLTQPAAIHWVDGSQEEYDLLCDQMVQSGTLPEAERGPVARLLLRPVRSERRRARRAAHVRLLAVEGRRRPDQQLGQPVRDARAS